MLKFGLAGEGPTDQVVLRHILLAFFQGIDNATIGRVQPLDKSDERAISAGSNWLAVLNYLSSSRLLEDLQRYEYIIVQIDTDIADEVHAKFKVTDENGIYLPDEEIVNNVIDKLVEKIDTSNHGLFQSIKERLIFAITVQSTECWLINAYVESNDDICVHDEKCFIKLQKVLCQVAGLDKHRKKTKHYIRASQCFLEDENLIEILAQRDQSFKMFISKLQQI